MGKIYESLTFSSPSALPIIAIAVILISGFLMTRITKKLKLPSVTAYIVAGIILGPYCFDIVPKNFVPQTEFLPDIALAFIAFSTGEFFKFAALKKNGGKVVLITVFEALTASFMVFILTFWILRLELAFSIVLAALASTTAPASTMMTIRQTRAHGDFVDTLLQVVALDDVAGLLAYSAAISIASLSYSAGNFSVSGVLFPLVSNLVVLILGAVFGFLLKLLMKHRHSSDNRLIISVALIFGFCGICSIMSISPLLGCMSMGTVYFNLTKDEKLFKQLNYFSPPILLLFFVRSGLSFDLNALFHAEGTIGKVPLLLVAILYFIVRILGKYIGAFLGCLIAKKPKDTRNYLGLALIPQAGVAIGLVALGARTLGGEVGNSLQTIILASSVLYELIGPAAAKLSLHLSKSYSTLEELAPVSETTDEGKEKPPVELLIERIQKIQGEIPKHEINEDEKAFTEAAETHYAAMNRPRWQRRLSRR